MTVKIEKGGAIQVRFYIISIMSKNHYLFSACKDSDKEILKKYYASIIMG